MPEMQQRFDQMSPERKVTFIAKLVDLISEGDKGTALRMGKVVGLGELPTEANQLVAYLKGLVPAGAATEPDAPPGAGNDIHGTPAFGEMLLGVRRLTDIQPSAAIEDRAAQLMGVIAGLAVTDLLDATQNTSALREYNLPRGAGFGVVLAKRADGVVQVFQVEVSKAERASRSADPITKHNNFSFRFRFIDEANRMADVSYCPRADVRDDHNLDRVRSSGYRGTLPPIASSEAAQLIGQYSFAAEALLARVLDSGLEQLARSQFRDMAQIEKASSERDRRALSRVTGTEMQTEDFQISQAVGGSLAALSRRVLAPVLAPVLASLRMELEMMVANGDFARIVETYQKSTEGLGNSSPGDEYQWRFCGPSVSAIGVGFRGASRRS